VGPLLGGSIALYGFWLSVRRQEVPVPRKGEAPTTLEPGGGSTLEAPKADDTKLFG